MKKLLAIFALSLLGTGPTQAGSPELLNVSYDVARQIYQELNPVFIAEWKQKTGEDLRINQSHGGSGKQARAVIDGLSADVVTMNSDLDIDAIADKGRSVSKDWASKLPHRSAPSWSTILFVVRKGNPKGIKDWGDLIKPGVAVVLPNPKTSGNGRYSYLAGWEWAKRKAGGDDAAGERYVADLLAHVPVLDTGGRGASTTFAQRGIGDVLLTFESEVGLLKAELGDAVQVVVPSLSVRADNPVAVVEKFAAKKGNLERAKAYLEFHYSDRAQEIFSNNDMRPSNSVILKKYASRFPDVPLFSVTEVYGSWAAAQARHFSDGGTFDQIALKKR